jgi:hypothetical protein
MGGIIVHHEDPAFAHAETVEARRGDGPSSM